jgi:hypothetical protein
MRRHIWRLKEKVGKHGRLGSKHLQTNLEPHFEKRFNTLVSTLGCKEAEALRLIAQDWLSHAQLNDLAEQAHQETLVNTKLAQLQKSIDELTSNLNSSPSAISPVDASQVNSAPLTPVASLSAGDLESLTNLIKTELGGATEILIQNSSAQYLEVEKAAFQTNHIHQLLPPVMGSVYAVLMLLLQYVVRKDSSFEDFTEEELPQALSQTRDFYARLGIHMVMKLQSIMAMPEEYSLDSEQAIRLFNEIDELMARLFKRGGGRG